MTSAFDITEQPQPSWFNYRPITLSLGINQSIIGLLKRLTNRSRSQ